MAKSMDSISTKNKEKVPTKEELPAQEKSTEVEKAAETTKNENTEDQKEITETRIEDPKTELAQNPNEEGQDSYENLFPEPTVVIGPTPNWIWWLIIIIVTVIISAVGFKLLDKKLDQWLGTGTASTATPKIVELETPTIQSTPTPTSAATTTPEPTATASAIDKSKISIRILNGTSISGAANKLKTTLEKAGFTIRTVGNASKNTYTETIIYYQEGKSAEAELVKTSLNDENSRTEQSDLANPDNILIVYGSK